MEIRKPKFELGQKVVDKNGNVETVIKFNSYHFEEDEYWYYVSYDGETIIKKESFLKPYIEKSEPKKKTVWDLKEEDTYYVIDYDLMNVRRVMFFDDTDDLNYRELGNCFLNKEEAEYELERIKIESEMVRLGGRRKFNRGKDNYYIAYDYFVKNLVYLNRNWVHHKGVIYFDTYIEAIDVVQEIGVDKIKKYIFGVE